ncbi:FERM domain-containing protein 1 [Cricetulus griseus]|nr:FERM domain-containing protein 1 [Cricetulus griseus]
MKCNVVHMPESLLDEATRVSQVSFVVVLATMSTPSEEESPEASPSSSIFEEESFQSQYRVLRTIGHGSNAKVQLAHHLLTGTPVAVKVLQKKKKWHQPLRAEVDIMMMISHPNIISLFQVIETEKRIYLIMELAEGQELYQYIRKVGHLKEDEARGIFKQIIAGVSYCHDLGIVHRDLKPDNIMLDPNGNVKIIDFGLGTQVQPGQRLSRHCGAYSFGAPELFLGRLYDGPKIDIWTLGVVLYFMVVGKVPFDAVTIPELRRQVVAGKYAVPSGISEELRDLLSVLMTVNPRLRPTMAEVMTHPWLREDMEALPNHCDKMIPSLPDPAIVEAMEFIGDTNIWHPEMNSELRDILVLLPTWEQLRLSVEVTATGQELFRQRSFSFIAKLSRKYKMFLTAKVPPPTPAGCKDVNRQARLLPGETPGKNKSVFSALDFSFPDNEYVFLDLKQKLSKYFSKDWKMEMNQRDKISRAPFITFFRVQFYVENGRAISDKTARYLYYCHLKEQVLRSKCMHREEAYFLLAACGLQADLGNHQESVHVGKYFEPHAYFPQWIINNRGADYILRHVPAMHREHRGLSPQEAILRFIRDACQLEDVPVHFFRLYKEKKEDGPTMLLGLTLKGVHIYREADGAPQLLFDFPWSHISKVTFLGKKLEIQPEGLLATRKLRFYTGYAWRSHYLLQLLRTTHQLHLRLRPVLQRLQQLGEAQEKKCYRESYISDPLEQDLNPHSRNYLGNEDNMGSRQQSLLSLFPKSHGKSHTVGMELNSLHGECEMSVDELTGTERLCGMAPSSSSWSSFSSQDTCTNSRGGQRKQDEAAEHTNRMADQVGEAQADHRGDQYLHSMDNMRLPAPVFPTLSVYLTQLPGAACFWSCWWPLEARAPLNGKTFINYLSQYRPGERSPLQEFVV